MRLIRWGPDLTELVSIQEEEEAPKLSPVHREKAIQGQSEKAAFSKCREEVSSEANSSLLASEMVRLCLLFKSPNLQYLVIEAQAGCM